MLPAGPALCGTHGIRLQVRSDYIQEIIFWNSNLFVLENTAHDLACVYHRPRLPGWYQREQVYDENSQSADTVVLNAELKVLPTGITHRGQTTA